MFFSQVDWVMVLGGKTIDAKYLSHHIMSRIHTVNMTSLLMLILITQLRYCLLDFSTAKLFPPLFILFSLEGSHSLQPILKEWGIMLQLLEGTVVM